MAFGVGIGDLLDLLDRGLDLYDKIKHREEIIKETADRMTTLKNYLKPLKDFTENRKGLNGKRPDQITELKRIVGNIEEDVQHINAILEKWYKNIGPGGFELRFPFVAQALFSLGSSPEQLQKFTGNLERRKVDISIRCKCCSALVGSSC